MKLIIEIDTDQMNIGELDEIINSRAETDELSAKELLTEMLRGSIRQLVDYGDDYEYDV